MSHQKDRKGMTKMHSEVFSCSVRRDGMAGTFIKQHKRLPQSWTWQILPTPIPPEEVWQDGTSLGVPQQRWWAGEHTSHVQPLLGGSWWKRLAARRVRQKEHSTTESFTPTKGVTGEITGWWAWKKQLELPNANKRPVGKLMAAERDWVKESDKSCYRWKMRKYLKYFPLVWN